ncbi:hypothetical protein NQD34_016679 [Periophthalmus magnuspinnatus]|nr:hypothetical protein NQD34_016679 [Periophthalmus magnuspinnatus]
MSTIISSLTNDQRNKLLSLFSHAQLHLLFKASVHGFAADQFHFRCDKQGPTVCVAFNSSGFVYGAYTSKDYAQSNQNILDERAFLFSIREDRPRPIRVGVTPGQHAFVDGATGPNFGALLFLDQNTATVLSPGGATFNFTAAEMHGDNLNLTEFEVYRVQEMGGVLEKPWRIIQWNEDKRQELKNRILSYRPDVKGVKEARVLMVGPVGAGKSSFFNSISSVFRGNMTSQAIAGKSGKSVTVQFRAYTIKAGKGGPSVPLTLCDTMGLEEAEDSGLHPDDVINICKGHVQDRYQFSPSAPLQEGTPGYRKNVTLKDKIHCVVYLMDASRVSLMNQRMLDKFCSIRKKVNQLGVPQILLMTKVDEACPLVEKDLSNIYQSVYIQKKVSEVSESLGVPLSCIVPVKNYCTELDLSTEVDVLLLSAVNLMLNYADSFFENLDHEEETDKETDKETYKSVHV